MTFLMGCLAISSAGAIGFAAAARGTATDNRAALTHRYETALQEKKDIAARVETLGKPRLNATIEEAIEREKQDRRWSSSAACTAATVDVGRDFCRNVGSLRLELTSATEMDALRLRVAKLHFDRMIEAGALVQQYPQIALLARFTGRTPSQVHGGLALIFAFIVEFGASFSLYLASLPMRGTARPSHWRRHAVGSLPLQSANRAQAPSRIVPRLRRPPDDQMKSQH
jgi:hypothetical protein